MKKEIDQELMFDMLEKGVARKELAGMLGISSSTLSNRIGDIQKKQGLLLQYRNIQALQLTELQARILESITPDKIEEAPLKDLVLCYKVLKDKELITDGKPSEIKGLVSYLIHMEQEAVSCSDQHGSSLFTPPGQVTYNDAELEEDLERLPNL
jgi:DNA-binding MarR family transcriptional regulator